VNQYEDPLKQIFEDLKARNDVVRDRLEDIVIEVNDSMEAAFAAEASIHTSSKNMLDPLAEVATLALPTLAPVSAIGWSLGCRTAAPPVSSFPPPPPPPFN